MTKKARPTVASNSKIEWTHQISAALWPLLDQLTIWELSRKPHLFDDEPLGLWKAYQVRRLCYLRCCESEADDAS